MPQTLKKEKCPDCEQCQMCSESRCRLCRGEHCKRGACELGSSFTYGDYLAWQDKKASGACDKQAPYESGPKKPKGTLKKIPVIDWAECTDCESCISLRPDVFKRNPDTDRIEVADLPDYPENEIEQVMIMCPGDCIAWQ